MSPDHKESAAGVAAAHYGVEHVPLYRTAGHYPLVAVFGEHTNWYGRNILPHLACRSDSVAPAVTKLSKRRRRTVGRPDN